MTKTFSSASNAKRAAAATGIPGGNIAIHKGDDGRFTFHDVNDLAVSKAAPETPKGEERQWWNGGAKLCHGSGVMVALRAA